jgi:two-component system, LytTR family, sensor kinase
MQRIGAVVNDTSAPSDGIRTDQRHSSADERQPPGALVIAEDALRTSGDSAPHWRSWLVTAAIVILFWVGYFAGVSAMWHFGRPPGDTRNMYVPRALVALAGVLISLGMVGVQRGLRDSSLAWRAAIALLMAVTAPVPHFFINVGIFHLFFPSDSSSLKLDVFISDYSWRLWTWSAMAGIILAMSYAADIRERERRILALQALAHSAQLRALRFQLNPHFLFNALNSVAGLISARRVSEAETMTENLADFLRLTLALDPQQLITLDEELRLQNLYLEIEKKRFPDRLTVRVDVPADLRMALVPSLITQPLIENSVKYAVAKSTRPVELAIVARRLDAQLELIVADSGGDAGVMSNKGARLGLRNVAERIHTHYGNRANISAEACADGGFRNRIVIPLEVRQ